MSVVSSLPCRVGSGAAARELWSATTWTVTLVARASGTAAAGQSGFPHRQLRWNAPANTAPNASARFWAVVRGSSAQTLLTMALSRAAAMAASREVIRPHTVVVPAV